MEKILEVKDLAVDFGDGDVIHDINFALEAGESLAIIGPNGSGKSVLLRALLGFIPHKGEILWAKEAKIGYVPQKIDLDRKVPMNVMNLLLSKAKLLGLKKSSIQDVIKRVHLDQRIWKIPLGHLSSGQMQRALVAFALLGDPNVILFDEPTASMDAPGEEQTYELIHRLQDEFGLTPIIVSHDLSFVYKYATTVLCLNRTGLCFGEPREVLKPGVLEKLYGTPHGYYHHLHDDHEKETHDHEH